MAIAVFFIAGTLSLRGLTDPWFAYSEVDKHLLRAHRYFARASYEPMLLCLKETLEQSPDVSTRSNAFELLDAAFARRRGAGIGLDWKLPPEISSLEIIQRRIEWADGTVKYQIRVAGNGSYRRLHQVQLIQHPGNVLIDKAANVGRWSEYETVRKDVEFRFNYHSDEIERPIQDGLFFLKIRFDAGKSVEGWFILSHLTPSRSPKILSPAAGQVVTSGTPSFYWLDFESDRYRDFEERALLVRLSPKSEQLTRWFLKRVLKEKRLVSDPVGAKVGREGFLIGAPRLDKGLYWLSVAYDEKRHMGDLVLAAQAMRIVPIVVKKP